MSKLNFYLNPFKLLLIILIVNQAFQAIPPSTDFQVLHSRELSSFELTKSKSEVYYSFENEYDDSDIILNFKIAKGFTSYCYIYDSYDKISQDSQGQYINAVKEFQMTEKTVILKKADLTIKKVKYYIIIKDLINSFNKDYISIFNEQDSVKL